MSGSHYVTSNSTFNCCYNKLLNCKRKQQVLINCTFALRVIHSKSRHSCGIVVEMQTNYINSEKVWRTLNPEINYSGLGEVILAKLNEIHPQRVLEVHYDSGTQLTVDDVRRQTIAVAQNLMRLGIKKGDTIVLYSVARPRVTPLTFACYAIGAPINFFETKFEEDAISHALEVLNPTAIIYEQEYKPQLFTALEHLNLPYLKHILSIDSDVLFQSVADLDDFEPPDIGDPTTVPATLMLTSGSTGFPKIIMHSHAMMIQGLYNWWQLESNSIIFCFSPLRWISQVSFMLQSVFFGVQRIYTSKPPSGSLGKDIIDAYKVTHFFTVPGIYHSVLRAAEQSNNSASLRSLKKALVGGEVVTEALVEFSAKVASECRVVKGYGMTELAGCIASDELINKPNVNGGSLVIGLTAKIIDDDDRSLGPNEMGRVCVKSTVPFLGYLKNKEANKEGFKDGGWLNTGDYGFIDSDNLLHIVTRYKYLIRSGGTIVIPNYVENIVNAHPSVAKSALVGHPNPMNPTDEVGTLFVVIQGCKPSKDIEDELKVFIRNKQTKEQLQIVKGLKVIPEMPLTSCGKVDRIALKELAIKGK